MSHLIGKYGVKFKPPSYHEIREKYFKQVMTGMEKLEEHKVEWKRTYYTIMANKWTDKVRSFICNFLMNNHKAIVSLKSVNALDICKITYKIFKMIDEVVEWVSEKKNCPSCHKQYYKQSSDEANVDR